jgi:hypothetical protein
MKTTCRSSFYVGSKKIERKPLCTQCIQSWNPEQLKTAGCQWWTNKWVKRLFYRWLEEYSLKKRTSCYRLYYSEWGQAFRHWNIYCRVQVRLSPVRCALSFGFIDQNSEQLNENTKKSHRKNGLVKRLKRKKTTRESVQGLVVHVPFLYTSFHIF